MLLQRVLRLVVNTRSFVQNCGIDYQATKKMSQTIEECIVSSPRILINNMVNCEKTSTNELQNTKFDDDEYEKAIKTLNTLQSNAVALRRCIANKSKQIPIDDTVKYLQRSGLNLYDLDKLSFIHVSGTKGKGSTCALTESILRSYGARTGFFSSPHLVSVTERFRINGQPIQKKKFTAAFWHVYKRLEKLQDWAGDMPAYFKFLTILSFHIFLEEQVDVAVLEVGVGGELDCTNIIRNTKTVGITSLGLEHTQLLGDTLEEIAWQKAGIIKNNSNVFTSVQQPECLKVIRERAAEKGATLYNVPDFIKYMHDEKTKYQLQNLNNVIQLNGSLAIQLAYDWLRYNKNGFYQDYAVNTTQLSDEVIKGLTTCFWPGRCQIVNYNKFKIHFDGAHTIESMCLCGSWFKKVSKFSKNPKVLIFNTTGDRDSKKLLEILRQKTDFNFACFVPNISTGSTNKTDNMTAYGISDQIKRAKLHSGYWHLLSEEANESDNSKVFGSVLDSLNFIRHQFGITQEIDVLVTGSLHLIGATVLALDEFGRRLLK